MHWLVGEVGNGEAVARRRVRLKPESKGEGEDDVRLGSLARLCRLKDHLSSRCQVAATTFQASRFNPHFSQVDEPTALACVCDGEERHCMFRSLHRGLLLSYSNA